MTSTYLVNCTAITCEPDDAAGLPVVPNAVVELADGVVRSISTGEAPTGAVVHDLGGRYLLPGLWDAHVHLGGLVPPYTDGHQAQDPRHQIARCIAKAQENLRHGVTSVRSLGEKDGTDLLVRDLFAAGPLVGPRVYASGDVRWSRSEAGVDNFRRRVRQAVLSGVDQVKLMATGGIPYPGPVTAPTVQYRELEAAIAEAHAWGRPVAVHAMGDETVRMAVECGADTIEHAFACGPDSAELLVREGLSFCPNLAVTEVWNRESICCQGLPSWMGDNAGAARAGHHEMFSRAVELGVRIIAGVDNLPRTGPGDYGIERVEGTPGIVRELELMRSLGLGATETLRTATYNAAIAAGVGDRTGSLKAGKTADLVVVDRNPLEDVGALAAVHQVWLDGRLVH